jgi:alpha-mannosidase
MTGRTPEGSPAGVSVLTDAKYAYDVDAASIGITAARSPAYAWHAPAVLDPAIDRAYQDQGVQRFRYAVLPHAGSRIDASTARLAAAFNAPPVTLLEGAHPGDLPAARPFADVGADGVGLAALKAAEDGSGDLVARLVELHGTGATTLLDLSAAQRTIEARLGPYQVRTYRLPADPRLPVTEVDLLEEPAEPATRHRPVSRPA